MREMFDESNRLGVPRSQRHPLGFQQIVVTCSFFLPIFVPECCWLSASLLAEVFWQSDLVYGSRI